MSWSARRVVFGCLLWVLLWVLLGACESKTTELLRDAPLDAASTSDARLASDARSNVADASRAPALCGDDPCACDDGVDNDEDGLVDGFDPECTGALDDDEASFGTGQPRVAGPCIDCYWDDNGGAGDDACRYPRACLEGKAPPKMGPCSSCEVEPACEAACITRTPNGCDCFGCCAVERADGSAAPVVLRDSCTLEKIDDPKACPSCVQNDACRNPCGPCELCPGRTLDRLPSECSGVPGEKTWTCDSAQRCERSDDCDSESYCQLGCCMPLVI